jgi:peptidoglycan/LPS O-acetylase OafA/YrhL
MNTLFENATGFIPFFVLGVAIHRVTFGLVSRSELIMLVLAFGLSLNSVLHWNNVESLSIFTPLSEIMIWFPTVRIPGNLIWFVVMLAIFFASLQVRMPRTLRRIDSFLGDLTYPMYATRFIVCAVIGACMPNASPLESVIAQLPAYLLVAYLLHQWLERPLYPLRDAFRGAHR